MPLHPHESTTSVLSFSSQSQKEKRQLPAVGSCTMMAWESAGASSRPRAWLKAQSQTMRLVLNGQSPSSHNHKRLLQAHNHHSLRAQTSWTGSLHRPVTVSADRGGGHAGGHATQSCIFLLTSRRLLRPAVTFLSYLVRQW